MQSGDRRSIRRTWPPAVSLGELPIRIEPNYASIQSRSSASHLARTETLKTKTGLSILSVMGLSSLRDELPEFRRTCVWKFSAVV